VLGLRSRPARRCRRGAPARVLRGWCLRQPCCRGDTIRAKTGSADMSRRSSPHPGKRPSRTRPVSCLRRERRCLRTVWMAMRPRHPLAGWAPRSPLPRTCSSWRPCEGIGHGLYRRGSSCSHGFGGSQESDDRNACWLSHPEYLLLVTVSGTSPAIHCV